MWSNDRQGPRRFDKRQTIEQNILIASSSFNGSREANDNINATILVIGSFAHCMGKVTTDTLRALINQHAQKPGVRSYREMVSVLFYTTGDAFAFVIMQSHDAATRAKDGLNGMEIFGNDIQAAFVPNALFAKRGEIDIISDKQPSQMSSIECNTDLNKQLSTSIGMKSKEISKEESTSEKDPWGRPTDGTWEAQGVGWDSYKANDTWGGGSKTTTQSTFDEKNVRSTFDKKDDNSLKFKNYNTGDRGFNNNFNRSEENVKSEEKKENSWGRSTEDNVNGWGAVNESWDNVINSNKTTTNVQTEESIVGNQREYGRNLTNNNSWNKGGYDRSNNDRPRGNDRGRGGRGGRSRGSGDRNSYARNDYNTGDRNYSSRGDFNSGDRGYFRGSYNTGNRNFSSRDDLNEDRIVEKKLSNTNVSNQYNKDRNFSNNYGNRSSTNFESRPIRSLFEPPSNNRSSSGPVYKGRGRGGSIIGVGQQRNEIEPQQQVEVGRNENNQRNDETDGSDGHDEEHKQQNGSPKKFGQLPKGISLKDDPFEIKGDPAGERLDNPPSKVIYITNLPGEVNKNELFAMLFAKKLNIVDCFVNRYTRENDLDGNAFAFAELGSEEEAKNAIELLNDTDFMDRKLRVIYSRKQTMNMSTTMMREAKRRRNRGCMGGDTSSVVSASNNNDGWDNGVNSFGGGSGDSWADFDDKLEEIGKNEVDINLAINSEVFPIENVCDKDDITISASNEEQVENEKNICEMVDDEEEQIKLKELEEEMDAEVEISKVVEFMVENVVNENGLNENTSFSSSESLVENDVNEAKEEYINNDVPINEDIPLTFIEPEENLPTKLTKDGNTPFTSTESLLEKDNANEDGETTPYASIESLVEKVENEESIN